MQAGRETRASITQLVLTGMAPTGEAIGRHEGLVVFVPYGLPGETVDVQLVEQKRSFARGEIIARHGDAPARVTPACPYFGACGGCDWQHVAYAEQLRFKTASVAEQLARVGKLPDAPVRPCIGSGKAYEYRNHVRLQVTEDGQLGYRRARSHAIVRVADCPISEPQVRRQIGAWATDEMRSQAPNGGEVELRAWEREIAVGGEHYLAGEGAFFQANTAVAAHLTEAVIDVVAGAGRVLDLYCGVGLFTLPLGRRVREITGVEANPTAAADAVHNLTQAGIKGQILVEDVGTALQRPEIARARWDAVVLDPPRAGVDTPALSALIALGAPLLVYVSCEPATLARDLRLLLDHGYLLEWAQPFDMFPQTRHVETLAKLVRA